MIRRRTTTFCTLTTATIVMTRLHMRSFRDPTSALRTTFGGKQTPALGLGHEMAHADASFWDRLIGWVPWPSYDNLEEPRVITGPETAAARTLGEAIRTDHGGTPYTVSTPISR